MIGVGSNSGGASGLESYYTDVLDGTDGREFGYLDENSDLQRTIVEPTNGNTIVSTLDINIQQVVEKYIAEFDAEYGKDAEDGKGAKNIGVIVGNPQNLFHLVRDVDDAAAALFEHVDDAEQMLDLRLRQ